MENSTLEWDGPEPAVAQHWIWMCAAGAVLGAVFASMWWVSMGRLDELGQISTKPPSILRQMWFFFLKAGAGALNGFILGTLQALALSAVFPRFSQRVWIISTMMAAVIIWVVAPYAAGIIGVLVRDDLGSGAMSLPLLAGCTLACGVVMGLVIGAIQAAGLAAVADTAQRWVWVNMFGWSLATLLVTLALVILGADQPIMTRIGITLVTASLAGAILSYVLRSSFARMEPRFALPPRGTHRKWSGRR